MRTAQMLKGAATAATIAVLGACGGDGNPTTVPQTCPAGQVGTPPDCRTPCTQSKVYSDSGGIPGSFVMFDDFSVPDTGRLDVTLDWTNASSAVGFYLVPANTCNTIEDFNARNCNFLIQSEPSSMKPRKISTPNFSAGNYRWLIANFSEEQESVSLQIVLSKGDCPALASVPPSAAERPDAPVRNLRSLQPF